ncbi:hypothetical protein [Lactobacillus sp. B4026]|uniref:hypothetical protein n=1 Tax=Lactobacillus sp. B4026 TaxID=2818035 RepID=UPI00226B32FB|nr:hypothetical protein [Lactobacillus sp. B4026]MCX8737298.1 hypothetical protein [Lactobacillus sp. B4026]
MDVYKKATFVINIAKVAGAAISARNLVDRIPNSQLLFSIKSQNDVKVLKCLSNYVDGFDVSSFNEYIFLKENNFSNDISITGSSFTPSDILCIYKNGDKFIFDSISLLKNFIKLIPDNKEIRIGLRIRVPYYNRLYGIECSKELQSLLKDNPNIKVDILHVHYDHHNKLVNKNNNRVFNDLLHFAMFFKKNKMNIPTKINLGGGLNELYPTKSINTYFQQVLDFQKAYSSVISKLPIITFEPGTLISTPSADIEVSIIDINYNESTCDVVVNASKFNLLPWCQPGLKKVKEKGKQVKIKIYGFTNYSGDYFGEYIVPSGAIKLGTRLTFINVGAYSINMQRHLQMLDGPEVKYLNEK